MKKIIYVMSAVCLMFAASTKVAYAQPVSDRAVIPVAVTLNQILRINVTDGGNIEFVFNTITDYKVGIANGASGFYDTNFNIASSTNWELLMGSESATFIGTDNPVNTMVLGNVCFQIVGSGLNTLAATNYADPYGCIAAVKDLPAAGTVVIGDGAAGNGGDILDNVFTINWQAGTASCTVSAATTMLKQNLDPDRYVTNVFLDVDIQ